MLRRSLPRGYAIAVIGAVLLLAIDQLVPSADIRNFALSVCFILSVMLASAVGGWKAGVLTTALGMAVHLIAFLEPRYNLKVPDLRETLRILAYCVAGGIISLLSEGLLRAWERVRERQRQLEREAERKNQFIATLAHELRNPLAPLRNGLQVLRLAGPQSEAADECLAMMERQLAHTVRLVDDLMDISRISRGKIELRKEPVALAEVIRHSLEASRPFVEGAGHGVDVTLPPDPVVVEGDLTRLAQVVCNLLNNAAKFTDRGGRIWLTVEREEGGALIRVRDNGAGIPPPLLPHVFDMFMQGDPTVVGAASGLGVGLSLAKALVELHGGQISAHSQGLGKGAEFIVRLPIVAASPLTNGRCAAEPAALPKKSASILVVDDNRDGACSLARLLEALGNRVGIAHNGREAIMLAEQSQPDLILLDISLPDIDGYEVCRRLRRSPAVRTTRIVAVTGWGQDEDRRRSHEAGFDDHLVKPVAPDAINELIAKLAVAKA